MLSIFYLSYYAAFHFLSFLKSRLNSVANSEYRCMLHFSFLLFFTLSEFNYLLYKVLLVKLLEQFAELHGSFSFPDFFCDFNLSLT